MLANASDKTSSISYKFKKRKFYLIYYWNCCFKSSKCYEPNKFDTMKVIFYRFASSSGSRINSIWFAQAGFDTGYFARGGESQIATL